MSRNCLLILSVFLLGNVVACAGNLASRNVGVAPVSGSAWLFRQGEWLKPPEDPDHAYDYRTAPVALLYFSPVGELSLLHCWIIEDESGMEISRGDGHSVFLGNWVNQGAKIALRYRIVYQTAVRLGQEFPGEYIEEEATISNGKLLFQGKKFRRIPPDRLKPKEIESYVSYYKGAGDSDD